MEITENVQSIPEEINEFPKPQHHEPAAIPYIVEHFRPQLFALEPRLTKFQSDLEELCSEFQTQSMEEHKNPDQILKDYITARKNSIILDYENFQNCKISFEVNYYHSLFSLFSIIKEEAIPSEKRLVQRTLNNIFKRLFEDAFYNFSYSVLKYKPCESTIKRLLTPSIISYAHRQIPEDIFETCNKNTSGE